MEGFFESQKQRFYELCTAWDMFKNKSPDKQHKGATMVQIDNIDSIWSDFRLDHDDMCSSDEKDDDHQYFTSNCFFQFKQKYLEVKGEFLEHLESLNSNVRLCPDSTNPQPIVSSASHSIEAELQKVPLPKFSGNYKEWSAFKGKFNSLVVSKKKLSDTSKLHYLISCLQNEPLDLIKDFPPEDDRSFEKAWNELIEHYENIRRTTSLYLAALFSLENMKSESSSEIRKILLGISGPLMALKSLNRPTDYWDDMIVHLATTKLDMKTLKDWEISIGSTREPPTLATLTTFLKSKCSALEVVEANMKKVGDNSSKPSSKSSNSHFIAADGSKSQCVFCEKPHALYLCPIFKKKTVKVRHDFVKSKRLCFNCLSDHKIADCPSESRCKTCKNKHHTLLHFETKPKTDDSQASSEPENKSKVKNPAVSTHLVETSKFSPASILLSTALVTVHGPHGHKVVARALIDQCSQPSFISEALCQQLRLHREPVACPVTGLNSKRLIECKSTVEFSISPYFESLFSCEVDANVVPKISNYRPVTDGNEKSWSHLSELQLADPQYAQVGRIDLLLGSAIHAIIIESHVIKGASNEPIATQSQLGWLISGPTSATSHHLAVNIPQVLHCAAETQVYDLLQKFWVREEQPPLPVVTSDEQACETHFRKTVLRNSDGRYTVSLPFKATPPPCFKDTFNTSLRMLYRMEKQFQSNNDFKRAYHAFMREYLELNHMSPFLVLENATIPSNFVGCFLPHHGVLKESSTTTKLRVVFNGSSKTKQGVSLNDSLRIGPNLLQNLVQLLINWRKYEFAFVADVEKMYRQIWVAPEDQNYQLILWRFDESHPVMIYKLTTITYGLSPSPFQANRVRIQLAKDEKSRFPLGSDALENETYMDDVSSGGHSIEEAKQKQIEVTELCKVGGFNLRKWLSNEPSILSDLPDDALASETCRSLGEDTSFAILGLKWQPKPDNFIFKINHDSNVAQWTKRLVLSQIAKLYDPLGLVSPVVVFAKIFLQKLWLHNTVLDSGENQQLSWDDPLPPYLAEEWKIWYNELPSLASIKIPRWLGYKPDSASLQIHGFADASKLAYGFVIYLRSIINGRISVALISSKSRVAPLKSDSLPRLELSAALELSRGIEKVLTSFKNDAIDIFCWVDAKNVLYWLKEIPSKWPTYVANRCAEIHNLVPNARWLHVRTAENPADHVSRGVLLSQLPNLKQWWDGPEWLSHEQCNWPSSLMEVTRPDFVTPSKSEATTHVVAAPKPSLNPIEVDQSKVNPFWSLLYDRCSSLSQVLGRTMYILKFIDIFVREKQNDHDLKPVLFQHDWFKIQRTSGTPSAAEWRRARLFWIYIVQRLHFSKEIRDLELGRQVANSSNLIKLSPVLVQGLLRCGGRLENSLLNRNQKKPLILPYFSKFTDLLIHECHVRTLHGGIQLTLSTLRTEYWIVKGRLRVKTVINKCLRCLRYRANPEQQMMADLPAARVQPSRPFSKSGVDYAGPFLMRPCRGRGRTTTKGYIVIFVCLSTKASHLEAVSDYTTETFLSAFDRFVARRGHCKTIICDQAANFKGADRELKARLNAASTQSQEIVTTLAHRGTTWRFNPPGAPHFGGLWEAVVKSTKYHLRRIVGQFKPTFEEFSTILCKIEACLNSRPLVPLSDDPNDLQSLTPAHFLIQSDSYLVPEPDCEQERIPITKRWRITQQMLQSFWRQWSREYLQTLNQRHIWHHRSRPIEVGDLVLVRAENTPPAQWPLARVTAIHPSNDDLPRVVTIRTATTTLDRPITKLILLLQSDEDNDDLIQ